MFGLKRVQYFLVFLVLVYCSPFYADDTQLYLSVNHKDLSQRTKLKGIF